MRLRRRAPALIAKDRRTWAIPGVTRQDWGFYYGVLRQPFRFPRRYGSYVLGETVLFKIAFLAEFHAQTTWKRALRCTRARTARGSERIEIVKTRRAIRIHRQEGAAIQSGRPRH